jgi:hypothetical protein
MGEELDFSLRGGNVMSYFVPWSLHSGYIHGCLPVPVFSGIGGIFGCHLGNFSPQNYVP